MKKLFAVLALMATPVYAGDEIEPHGYKLPEFNNPVAYVYCASKEATQNMLDNLMDYIQMYSVTRVPPPNCIVFNPPRPFPSEPSLDSLYVLEDGGMYALLDFSTDQYSLWTYIDYEHLLKKDSGDT